jgi:hypothetical protein
MRNIMAHEYFGVILSVEDPVMLRLRLPLLFVLVFLGLGLLSCHDEDGSTCPTCPCGSAGEPTLQNIWPNADSTAWTYSVVQRQWPDTVAPGLYQSRADVPPVPDISDVEHSLWAEQPGDTTITETGMYRLQFLGRLTSGTGAQIQNLQATVLTPQGEPILQQDDPSAALFRHLALARPDLRAKFATEGPIAAGARVDATAWPGADLEGARVKTDLLGALVYLHGGAWEKTADHIGSYANPSLSMSWKYLDQDLAPGHEFVFRLLPDMATDMYIHARILPRRSVNTEAGRFANCVEYVYLIDYGVSALSDDQGNPRGYYRSWDFASIIYAPGIGPVMCYQHTPVMAPREILPSERLYSTDYRISLLGTNARNRNP